jgi:hypothetical protein
MTADEIAVLAQLMANKTSLGAMCSDMEIRTALEFLNGRGFLRAPPENHPALTRRSKQL